MESRSRVATKKQRYEQDYRGDLRTNGRGLGREKHAAKSDSSWLFQ